GRGGSQRRGGTARRRPGARKSVARRSIRNIALHAGGGCVIHALVSGVVTFVLALVLGAPILRYLRAKKAGKSIGEYQPESHQSKAGTPPFGGFIIWVPTLIVTAIAVDWREHRSILLPLAMIAITGAA